MAIDTYEKLTMPCYIKPVLFTMTNCFGHGPDYEDDVYTVEAFRQAAETWVFVDSDGFGYPVRNEFADPKIIIKPSKINEIPADATHIVWFNR
jgi:hypothetical protein